MRGVSNKHCLLTFFILKKKRVTMDEMIYGILVYTVQSDFELELWFSIYTFDIKLNIFHLITPLRF